MVRGLFLSLAMIGALVISAASASNAEAGGCYRGGYGGGYGGGYYPARRSVAYYGGGYVRHHHPGYGGFYRRSYYGGHPGYYGAGYGRGYGGRRSGVSFSIGF